MLLIAMLSQQATSLIMGQSFFNLQVQMLTQGSHSGQST
jgi:hypothetical protein